MEAGPRSVMAQGHFKVISVRSGVVLTDQENSEQYFDI